MRQKSGTTSYLHGKLFCNGNESTVLRLRYHDEGVGGMTDNVQLVGVYVLGMAVSRGFFFFFFFLIKVYYPVR